HEERARTVVTEAYLAHPPHQAEQPGVIAAGRGENAYHDAARTGRAQRRDHARIGEIRGVDLEARGGLIDQAGHARGLVGQQHQVVVTRDVDRAAQPVVVEDAGGLYHVEPVAVDHHIAAAQPSERIGGEGRRQHRDVSGVDDDLVEV